MKSVGTRAEVMHGTARTTSGSLTKKDLKMVRGSIVSKAASVAAKKRSQKSLFQKFITLAKASKRSKTLRLAPKKGTKEYTKIMKK